MLIILTQTLLNICLILEKQNKMFKHRQKKNKKHNPTQIKKHEI